MSEPVTEFQTPNVTFERERGVYAIHVTHDVAHAIISLEDRAERGTFIAQALRVLANKDIPVFLVKLHRSAVTLALVGHDVENAANALQEAGFQTSTRRDLALVVVRATSMRDMAGVMVEIADALAAANARLYETGDSHNSVQCLIEAVHAPQAVAELCKTFSLDPRTAVLEVSSEAEEDA